jgi:hypothetical protein
MMKPDVNASVCHILRDNWFKNKFRINLGENEIVSLIDEIDVTKEDTK